MELTERRSACHSERAESLYSRSYKFTSFQDACRVGLVDGLETNILRVSPVNRHVISNELEVDTI